MEILSLSYHMHLEKMKIGGNQNEGGPGGRFAEG
jgi:hypothetical protein